MYIRNRTNRYNNERPKITTDILKRFASCKKITTHGFMRCMEELPGTLFDINFECNIIFEISKDHQPYSCSCISHKPRLWWGEVYFDTA